MSDCNNAIMVNSVQFDLDDLENAINAAKDESKLTFNGRDSNIVRGRVMYAIVQPGKKTKSLPTTLSDDRRN